MQDVTARTPMGIGSAGLDLYVLGQSDENLSGSEWAHIHGQMGDAAPILDLQIEKRLIALLLEGQPLFEAAHDISNGGLAATLSEMVLRHGIGATITIENPGIQLMVETPGRVVVAVTEANNSALQALAAKRSIPLTKLGTTGGTHLVINGSDLSISELRSAHSETFPRLFG